MRFARLVLMGVATFGVACGSDSFQVGGTVTGLKGRGFTLQNNGGEPLAVNAAGPFSFPDKLEEGAAYAITVGSQPTNPRQSCGVQNGTGKVGEANVSDVQVLCATNTYSVGGTVNGLTDTSGSVTVQLNGSQSVSVSSGPFTFPNRLEDANSYSVSVTASPPEHDCSVVGGSGQLNGADVNTIQVNCPLRTYQLGGTVEGLTRGTLILRFGQEGLPIVSDGRFLFAARLPKGASYAVTIGAQPEGQRCLLSNASGTMDGDEGDIAVRCFPYYQFATNSPAATRVIGQSTFVTAPTYQGRTPWAGGMSSPAGNPVLAGERLYISDSGSNRVLGFPGLPTSNGAEASFVLGQADFQTVTRSEGPGGLGSPQGLSSDGTRLAVADAANNRVLLYSALPTTTGAQANNVVGQADFASTVPSCDPISLSSPSDVFLGYGKLIVADTENSRVLVWNTIPTTNGAPADLVLGQSSFTTCVANDANGDRASDSTPSATTLNDPKGVWTDGTRLVVADTANNRVLIWNQFPTRVGQAADVVLGQASFTSRLGSTAASGLSAPGAVRGTPLQLFVVDRENHRVLVWNQFPTANATPANVVLGQRTFVAREQPAPPTSESLSLPGGILLAWPQVGVVDTGNHRVLLFESR